MSFSTTNNHVENLLGYFNSNFHDNKQIIVEIDHFLVYSDTNEAVPYEGDFGIAYVLRELSVFYPDAKMTSKGHLLGFKTDKFVISLAPGGQLKIRFIPVDEISSIKKTYENFRSHINEVIEPFGYECMACGYQPYNKAEDISLIPKSRYIFLDRYFKTTGKMGDKMLKGSGGLKVSISYSDEEDFRRKFQTACYLSPFLKLITDYSPVYEGEENDSRLLKTRIFYETDPARFGIVPCAMDPDFGLRKYAEYLLDIPPIYVPAEVTEEDSIYTGNKSAASLMGDSPLSEAWIKHMITIVYPDIRVTDNIEINLADSMPSDCAFGYCALIKGLLYNKSFLDFTDNFLKTHNTTVENILEVTKDIIENGWDSMFYTTPMDKTRRSLIATAKKILPPDEAEYLDFIPGF